MKRINETQLKGKKGFCCGRNFDGILCGEIASPTEKILCDACFDKINDTDDTKNEIYSQEFGQSLKENITRQSLSPPDVKDTQNELEKLKETYDIAMQEIARLRKKLSYDTNQDKGEKQ